MSQYKYIIIFPFSLLNTILSRTILPFPIGNTMANSPSSNRILLFYSSELYVFLFVHHLLTWHIASQCAFLLVTLPDKVFYGIPRNTLTDDTSSLFGLLPLGDSHSSDYHVLSLSFLFPWDLSFFGMPPCLFPFCISAVHGNTCYELPLFFTVYVFQRSHIHFSLAKLGCTVVFQVPLMLHYFC